jgi:hypothetical protein
MCPCGCGKEDHGSNSSDNGSTASGGPGGLGAFSLPSPPPSSTSAYPTSLPNSPDLSPIKDGQVFVDAPLDMSKTSPVYGVSNSETPPPSPPENDRDKFRCLYLLVDAAVEELERQKQQLPGRVCA